MWAIAAVCGCIMGNMAAVAGSIGGPTGPYQ